MGYRNLLVVDKVRYALSQELKAIVCIRATVGQCVLAKFSL
ncbi:hypothetical protein KP509_01G084600 [Ceratopteris richardii]|uniref:Uncharacterized protein n=1 Tax=Ceratopteris richardii TaxID=49495 RepID=A0A8T2VMK1_CERRI|nr:hypothetical protein KP509_01G084600 [Ceratopteris richardii]